MVCCVLGHEAFLFSQTKKPIHRVPGIQRQRGFISSALLLSIKFYLLLFPLYSIPIQNIHMPHTMYPDWPQSDADLIPLPQCDGPKLKPFDFAGTQAIEFLEHIGEGTHSHVFKVAIHKQTYALKLVRGSIARRYEWDRMFMLTNSWVPVCSSASPMIALGLALRRILTPTTAN